MMRAGGHGGPPLSDSRRSVGDRNSVTSHDRYQRGCYNWRGKSVLSPAWNVKVRAGGRPRGAVPTGFKA